jgi:hypothetical protein
MDGWLWAIVIIGGPLLLGLCMYVFGQRRRLNSVEQQISDQKARENWGKERIR